MLRQSRRNGETTAGGITQGTDLQSLGAALNDFSHSNAFCGGQQAIGAYAQPRSANGDGHGAVVHKMTCAQIRGSRCEI